MQAKPLRFIRRSHRPLARAAAGFSITELLVVIGIIVLLIGILLPALNQVRTKALVTQTLSTMEEFGKAADAFNAEFGVYPGIVPEAVLAADPEISSTENAILHMMGGAIAEEDVGTSDFNDAAKYPPGDWTLITFGSAPNQYRIKVNKKLIGQGPRINGRQYGPFFAPKGDEFGTAMGQNLQDALATDPFEDDVYQLPDLLDAWGQPIIYLRKVRNVGPLVGAPGAAQFTRGGMTPYLDSVKLGESGKSQDDSILWTGVTGNDVARDNRFAQIIRNEAFGEPAAPLTGTSRGAWVLLSAGPDGVFYSHFDGQGTNSSPQVDIVTPGPKVVTEFDDIRRFGGG